MAQVIDENLSSKAGAAKSLSEEQIQREFFNRDHFGDLTICAIYEEITDNKTDNHQGLIHITNPYEENGVVVSIPTQASREDVTRIVAKISPVPEFCAMLAKMAECYELGKPLMIEGGTAVGKTFMVNKFTELLYGRGVKPLDFFCSGQTDVSDLIGKWVPREGSNTEVQQKWEQFLRSEEGQSKIQQIGYDIAKTGDELNLEDKAKMYQARIAQLASDAGLSSSSDFTFQLGAIPKAFMGEYRDGKFVVREGGDGFIVHVQEAGLAKPAVLNSLLRVRGEQGKIADELQLWEDSGRIVRKGPKTFIVFTNNPVDGYLDRKPIDPALSRGLEWLRFGEGLSEKSLAMTARKIFGYALGNDQEPTNRHSVFDFRAAPEVGEAIGLAMVGIHEMLASHFNSLDQDDPQMMPVVMDNMFKVAEAMQNHQVKSGGQIDVGKTLMRAIEKTYLERATQSDRESLRDTIKEKIFGETSKMDFEGNMRSFAERLDVMAKRATKAISVKEKKLVVQEAGKVVTDNYFEELQNLLD